MNEKHFVVPAYVTAEEIKQTRKMLGLTQKEFAALIGSSKPTVERWERSQDSITGPIVLLLKMLNKHSDEIQSLEIPSKEYPLRMWYMHEQKKCTLIDVDEMNRKVKIHNFIDHVMFRAFGSNEEPTYEDYEQFVESRCFPRTRDKMKIILEDLDVPFYDPLLIIKKTQGKMAEDHFWIKIE